MPRSLEGQQARKRKLRARIESNAQDHFRRCVIIGCGKPTQRAARNGLGLALCRSHLAHRQRHGSPFCKSPSAGVLKPYLKSALSHIDLHRNNPFISAALIGLADLMASSGEAIIATRLRGLSPERRARVALARLRDANIKPERLLAIVMAVHALIEGAPALTHRITEWRIVAVAKAAHRLSSGYHRVWAVTDDAGRIVKQSELHAWPRSAGRVLRHLGRMIERPCELAVQHHLPAVLALKLKRYGRHQTIP